MRFFIFALLFLSTNVVYASCGKEKTHGISYTWCIAPGETSAVTDIIYYMHGGGGSEKAWDKSGFTGIFAPVWKKIGYKRPAVITVSFGRSWLLSDMETKEHPALLTVFAEEIIPYLEGKIKGKHGKRMIFGPSMGGYNGAELALRYPELWDRVALMCPGVYVTYPFQTDEQIEEFIAKQPKTTLADNIRGVVQWVRREFVTPQNWDRHDPMQLADLAVNPKASYLLSCSKDDQYGFFDGAKHFADVMAGKTSSVWYPVEKGGHCALDKAAEEGLAKFLAGQ